jgi:hypothetical protein
MLRRLSKWADSDCSRFYVSGFPAPRVPKAYRNERILTSQLSSACTKSTTAYFCCDDPKAGSNPAPDPGADTNLCEIPRGIIDESGESEPEDPGNSLTEIELYEQESDCYVGGVDDSGDSSQPQ